MTSLERAYRYLRGEGYTVHPVGNDQFAVTQAGSRRTMTERELLSFAGIAAPTAYVVGFLFDEDRESVALIEKRKGPREMAGKLNGIGGKIEPGETPAAAMEREFGEEAGVAGIDWEHVAELRGPDFVLHVYAGFHLNIMFVRSQEAEQVAVYDIASVLTGKYPLMANLPTLITLALDRSGIVKPVLLFDGVAQERGGA